MPGIVKCLTGTTTGCFTETYKHRKVYVLLCTSVCQCVCLLSFVIYWRNLRKEIVSEKETELCFPKSTFDEPLEDMEEKLDSLRSVYTKHDNTTVLCGLASNILHILAFKSVYKLYNSNAHPEVSMIRKYKPTNCREVTDESPFLKLVGIEDKTRDSVGSTAKIFWKSKLPIYFHSGPRYNESHGHVHIKKSGTYFITSQIRTRIRVTNDTQSLDNVIHRVHHISDKRKSERILLEHVKTLCEPVSPYAEQSSTVGAIFNLVAYDQVYVSTSHPGALVAGQSSNYFTIAVL